MVIIRRRDGATDRTLIPAKTAALIEMPFGLRIQVGPRNHVLDGGPDLPWEEAVLKGGVPLYSIGRLCSHLYKNGCTDRDAVWVVGSDGPKESCVRSGSTGAKGHCHVNQFLAFSGYNFGCMVASDMLFDSRGGFLGSSYWMKT